MTLQNGERSTRMASRIYPLLGRVDQTDDGRWRAETFTGLELGVFDHRAEAGEALLVFAVFGDGT
jgi:hypothetical protein